MPSAINVVSWLKITRAWTNTDAEEQNRATELPIASSLEKWLLETEKEQPWNPVAEVHKLENVPEDIVAVHESASRCAAENGSAVSSLER